MDEHGYSVYKHRFPNGKVYIGVTGSDPMNRWSYGYGYSGQPEVAAEIRSCGGWNKVAHIVLCSGLTKEQAYGLEKALIHEAVCDLGEDRVLNTVGKRGAHELDKGSIAYVVECLGGSFTCIDPICDWLDRYNAPSGEIALTCKIDEEFPVVVFMYERRAPHLDTGEAYGFEIIERAISYPAHLTTVDALVEFLKVRGYDDTHSLCVQEALLPRECEVERG